MQVALAADVDGVLAVRMALIVPEDIGGSKERVAHSHRIALPQMSKEEEFLLRYKALLGDQDSVQKLNLTGRLEYECIVLMYKRLQWREVATSTRILGAGWGTIPSRWMLHNIQDE